MEEGDEWLAYDKSEHVIACFLISVFFSLLARRSHLPSIRRRTSAVGSMVAIAAGAAKEAGDEIGLWASAGGSVKDVVADLVGVVLANLLLARLGSPTRRQPDLDADRDPVSMV